MATPIVPPHKTCTKCGVEYPATTEYFYPDKRLSSGLRADCKKCKLVHDRQYHSDHLQERHEYSRQYRADHAEAIRTSMQQWRKNNPDYEQQCRAANPEKYRARSRSYYARTADKRREEARRSYYKHHHKHREKSRKWHQENPDKVRVNHHKRRTRKMAGSGTHTAADIQIQFQRQKGHCYYCECKLTKTWGKPNSATVDHVVPLSRGGSNDPSNLVIACDVCNKSKNNKLLHEWTCGGRLL